MVVAAAAAAVHAVLAAAAVVAAAAAAVHAVLAAAAAVAAAAFVQKLLAPGCLQCLLSSLLLAFAAVERPLAAVHPAAVHPASVH